MVPTTCPASAGILSDELMVAGLIDIILGLSLCLYLRQNINQ
jgi:hypothetical protein